jgi:hypothetical protein
VAGPSTRKVVAGFHTGDRLRNLQSVGVDTDAHQLHDLDSAAAQTHQLVQPRLLLRVSH